LERCSKVSSRGLFHPLRLSNSQWNKEKRNAST
jgi:hypothetical protein